MTGVNYQLIYLLTKLLNYLLTSFLMTDMLTIRLSATVGHGTPAGEMSVS